jgi:hypothetical protein
MSVAEVPIGAAHERCDGVIMWRGYVAFVPGSPLEVLGVDVEPWPAITALVANARSALDVVRLHPLLKHGPLGCAAHGGQRCAGDRPPIDATSAL